MQENTYTSPGLPTNSKRDDGKVTRVEQSLNRSLNLSLPSQTSPFQANVSLSLRMDWSPRRLLLHPHSN